jgi:hypothetical protein
MWALSGDTREEMIGKRSIEFRLGVVVPRKGTIASKVSFRSTYDERPIDHYGTT